MEISKDLKNSILQKVLAKVENSMMKDDDNDEITGLVNQQLNEDEDKEEGILGLLGNVLGGDSGSSGSSGGLGGILSGLSSMLGGGKAPSKEQKKESALSSIAQAIGGEEMIGNLLEKVLNKKGVSASQLSSEDDLDDDTKETLTDKIKDFVLDNVKTKLQGSGSSSSRMIGSIIDMFDGDD